jgi:hypothetical protein
MGDLLGNDAYISECGKYRYSLERHVGAGHFTYAFFGINPSTADASVDDQTVRKWRGYSERNHVGRFIVGNVFSYRATDVKELGQTTDCIFGDDHWRMQDHIIKTADALVPCWGRQTKLPPHLRPWVDQLFNRLCCESYRTRKPLLCFGLTKDGDPKHPLTLGYEKHPLLEYPATLKEPSNGH